MGQNDSEREVACTLTDEEEAERPDEVLSVLTSRYVSYEERENSVDVRFDGTDESLRAIARFNCERVAVLFVCRVRYHCVASVRRNGVDSYWSQRDSTNVP